MKLKGFTLIEVLVTILLLGSVAALTLPTLNVNIQKQQTAPTVLKAISLLDTSNAFMMNEEDFYSFKSACIERNSNAGYVSNCFEPFIMNKIGAYKDTVSGGVYTHRNGTEFSLSENLYATQNGFSYYFYQEENKPYTTVLIDTNGYVKKPNQFAKDVFVAYIYHETGKVYAAGSNLEPSDIGEGNAWPKWNDTCKADEIVEPDGDIYCAGSIVDNNGKIVYPY